MPAEDWRYERKFLVRHVDPRSVERFVLHHPAHFRVQYPARQVNNIYLDTASRRAYFETADGVATRVKHRLRWYGSLFGETGEALLERKAKQGLLGTKQQAPLPPFVWREREPPPDLAALFAAAALPPLFAHAMPGLEPVLANHYARRYYASADGALRLTLDSDLRFLALRRRAAPVRRWRDLGTVVLELKYAPGADAAARRAAQHWPFRATRSSKYARGIEGLARGTASG